MRGASPPGRGLTPRSRCGARGALIIVLSIAGLLPACARGSARADVSIDMTLTPSSPVVGEPAIAALALRDGEGRLLRGARVWIEAHMTHPGMTPVLAGATERPDGIHEVPLRFTMAGDWTFHVTGELADGRTLDRWIDVAGIRAVE